MIFQFLFINFSEEIIIYRNCDQECNYVIDSHINIMIIKYHYFSVGKYISMMTIGPNLCMEDILGLQNNRSVPSL